MFPETGRLPEPRRVERLSYAVDERGLNVGFGTEVLRLEPVSLRTLRVRYSHGNDARARASLAVTRPTAERAVPFTVEPRPGGIALSTAELTVEIDGSTGSLAYRMRDGTLLMREPVRGGRTLDPTRVMRWEFDPDEIVEERTNADGVRVDVRSGREVFDRDAFHVRLGFEWLDGEALYGLGAHEEGMFNLRGQHQYLYQQNLKVSVPVLLSTRGYGVFLDCTSLVTFHDDAFGSYLWGDVDDELDYYFMVGPEFDTIIRELRELTGGTPMLPRWAFGYLQSKERYETQSELLEVAREYRARGLPLDGIVLDWKSWVGDNWGQKSLDPARFPDPDGLTRELHELGVHLMVSIWPTLRAGGDDWRELSAAGHLLANRATYDAFCLAARRTYWEQANRGLFAHGVDAWWSDCTEPFEADWAGAVKPEPEERVRINVGEAKRYLDPALVNAYSLLHSEGIYTGQRSVRDDKRVFNLTRSAFAGQQRYGTASWSGDVSATWETLRRQIADALNFGASGLPWWSTDIGGFFVARKPELWFWHGEFDRGIDDAGYRELYLRWFQYAAWLPIFRSHGTDTPREVWRFGSPGDPIHDALVNALELRYRLLPYIYSVAAMTALDGYTMVRALPFDFRADERTYRVDDQFMFGPAILVCPVHRPSEYGPGGTLLSGAAPSRRVYLPAGADWWDPATGDRLAGGCEIDVETTLERIPTFVRAGSIVPMGPVGQHAGDRPGAPLEVHIYAGRNATFTLYEDEGDGYAYEKGASATVDLAWDEGSRRLAIGRRSGRYPGMAVDRELLVFHHRADAPPAATKAPEHRSIRYVGEPVIVEC